MKKFLIFKTGEYPQGDFSNIEVFEKFVEKFNNSKTVITCFVGHRWVKEEYDEYSLGEISELSIEGNGKIYATEYELSDHLLNLIDEKKLRYVSVELAGNKEEIRITGVAFLGRTPPQIKETILPFENGKTIPVGFFEFDRNVFKKNKKNKGDLSMDKDELKEFSKKLEEMDKKVSELVDENKKLKEENAKFSQAQNEKNKLETEKEFVDILLKCIIHNC